MTQKPKPRNADSTIRGFEYQFLLTQKQFLNSISKEKNAEFTIEGIEDLDVRALNSELHQYKYYEKTSIRKSTLQEPIAYMYCYWEKNKTRNINYRLFVYSENYVFNKLDVNDILYILKLTNAKKIIIKEGAEVTRPQVEAFCVKFSFKKVEKFETERNNVISLIAQVLHKNNKQSKSFYYPLISQYIHSVAIKRNKSNRTISTNTFLHHIQRIDKAMEHNFSATLKNDQSIINVFIKQMKEINYSDNHKYSYILSFGKNWRGRINAQFIENIARLFAFKGNRVTNLPISFLFNYTAAEMSILKKELLSSKDSASLIMNDGFENLYFNKDIFLKLPVYRTTRNGTLYDELSFNYRIASTKNGNFSLNLDDPFFLNFDFNCESNDNYVCFNGFQPDFVIQLMRRLSK